MPGKKSISHTARQPPQVAGNTFHSFSLCVNILNNFLFAAADFRMTGCLAGYANLFLTSQTEFPATTATTTTMNPNQKANKKRNKKKNTHTQTHTKKRIQCSANGEKSLITEHFSSVSK